MEKVDYRKKLKHIYSPSPRKVEVVEVPPMNFLMVDGEGDPNTSSDFKEAVEALFGLSYTLKFMVKRGPSGLDYGVMPLEGLFWVDDMSAFSTGDKDSWKWTLMVMQPEPVTAELVDKAFEEVRRKKDPPALARIRFESFSEGKAAQIMHIGPFSEEGPTIEKVHRFIEEEGCRPSGRHHEIYLSDIRKAAPEKWRTVVRQPMS